ncbi:IclR family transcriptional regulator [Tistlia consotensis]|uniref:IclR family transcriptional regulator n=1 Tax=Tistlia consotensis TaxID=1321365 RepID=UPI0013566B75|nr:IclR family transcriptional regulator [Tistlia consotensis]
MEGDRKFVTALARGLDVLRAFQPHEGLLGNQEIAERTGLPKPTVSRLTYTLCTLGYLTHVTRLGKYQLAPGAITLGYAALANLGVRHAAHGFMEQAAEALSAQVGLGVLYRNSALYVDVSRGSATYRIQLDIGSRIPLAATAMGRALLVAMPEAQREARYAGFAERHPAEWPVLHEALEAAVEEYREYGFVTSTGEWRGDVHAVGVPLVAADGSGLFAFNCGGPPHQFPPERLRDEIGPAIAALARQVEDLLSGRRLPGTSGDWLAVAQARGGGKTGGRPPARKAG